MTHDEACRAARSIANEFMARMFGKNASREDVAINNEWEHVFDAAFAVLFTPKA